MKNTEITNKIEIACCNQIIKKKLNNETEFENPKFNKKQKKRQIKVKSFARIKLTKLILIVSLNEIENCQ